MLTKITNGKILTPTEIVQGDILISETRIEKITKEPIKVQTDKTIDAQNQYVLPGFIDIHTNGNAGFDCTYGKYNYEEDEFNFEKNEYFSGLKNAAVSYFASGCTKVILSTISAPFNQVVKVTKYIKEFKDNHQDIGDVIHGVMIEGSFIKEQKNAGAHNPKYFRSPNAASINKLLDQSSGLIKIINVPPEWGKDALSAYDILKEKNIIAAIGHSCATSAEVISAITKGLKLGIHLFNGPSSSSFKPFSGGGVIEALLKSENAFVEIIADGIHVDKAYFMDALKRKGKNKIIAITDNMFITGSDNINEFEMGNKVGILSKDKKYICIKEKELALFGSNLRMDTAFENLLNWFTKDNIGVWNNVHKAIDFSEALHSASELCSKNPSDLLRISDDYGTLEVGKKADIVIAEIKNNGEYSFKVKKTLLNGD